MKKIFLIFIFAVMCISLCVEEKESMPNTTAETVLDSTTTTTTSLLPAVKETTSTTLFVSQTTATTVYDLSAVKISEMQVEACVAAAEAGNCAKLYDLGIVLPQDCCINLGMCC